MISPGVTGRGIALAFLLAASVAVCDERLPDWIRNLPHAEFDWSAAKEVSDRGAIRLPIVLDGKKGWLQLDTGLDVTRIYGGLPEKSGWEQHQGFFRVPDLKIGGIELGPVWVQSYEEHRAKGGLLGSLGLDLLIGKWVVIDYPGRRFLMIDPGAASADVAERITWTPATIRDGKFFPYIILGRKDSKDFFFDTGSSAFDLIVDRADWLELKTPDAEPVEVKGPSWGEQITIVGAPAAGSLIIGSARIEGARVYYIKERPEMFAQWPFPARGLIGNAPFFEEIVVLDLGLRPRFGILR